MTISAPADDHDAAPTTGRANAIVFGQTLGAGDTGTRRVQRDALLAFAVRCASAAVLYLSQIALARWMGAGEYGIYVFVWTCVLLLGGLSHLGFNLSIIRLIPVYREAGDLPGLRGLVHGGGLFAFGMGTLVALLGAAGLAIFSADVSDHYRLAAYMALVCVPLYALTDIQDGIGRGHGWIAAALVPPYVLRPLLILTGMSIAFALGLPMVAATAAQCAIIATWASGLIQAVFINRGVAAAYGAGARTYAPKAWLAASLPLLAISGCEILLQNTDILVLSRYTSPADVAIYFASAKTMSLIMFVHYAVGSAVANRFASLKQRGDDAGLRACVRDAVNWTFWPSLAAAVIILALGRPLLSLFGPGFEAGYPVMAILVAGFLTRSAMGPAEFLLNMLGEQKRCAAVMAVAAALNIGLNLALVPVYGIIGAALATAASLITAALANAWVARTRLGIDVAIWRNVGRL